MSVIWEPGVYQVLARTRSSKAKEIANNIKMIVFTSPIEADCIRILESAFEHFSPVKQFFISGYRIDLYFPNEKIAVECDEYGHENYDPEKELKRQNIITKALNCDFVRFNPHEKNFNIGKVINEVLQKIY
jgi:very-short-patch-repair endonuclease